MQFKNPIRMVEEMKTSRRPFAAFCSRSRPVHSSRRCMGRFDCCRKTRCDGNSIFRAFSGSFFAPILVRTFVCVADFAFATTCCAVCLTVHHYCCGLRRSAWCRSAMPPRCRQSLFVAMGAMFILGEKVYGPRWLALVIGFAGARDCPARISANRSGHDAGDCLDVIRHVFETDCCLCPTDQPSTIVAYLSLTMMVPSGVALFFVWRPHADAASLNGRHWVYGKLRSHAADHRLQNRRYFCSRTRSICASRLGGDRWLVHVRGVPGFVDLDWRRVDRCGVDLAGAA